MSRRCTRCCRTAVLLAAAGGIAGVSGGCTRGESRPVDSAGAAGGPGAAPRETVAVSRDVPDPELRPARPAYRAVAVAGAGTVSGTVVVDSAAAPPAEPVDTALARLCRFRPGGRAAEAPGNGPAGAVVWLEGVSAGKPMPAARRYELALTDCRLTPRTLAAAAGGTLNVHGVDALPSRLVFLRAAGEDAGRVLLRTTMSAAGQVVPDERVLAAAGPVEVRSEAPAGLRAWVLAFDQPYFAAAGDGGAFAFADVPPGNYRVVAWHPRLGRTAQPVTVAAGQATAVTLALPRSR